jgi:hypothetical protein
MPTLRDSVADLRQQLREDRGYARYLVLYCLLVLAFVAWSTLGRDLLRKGGVIPPERPAVLSPAPR